MKQKTIYIILCLLTLVFMACERNIPVNDDYGISAALSWADSNDVETEIKDAHVWIFQASGKLVTEKNYSSKQEIALEVHPVDVGEYLMVVATNLVAPLSADKATTSESLIFRLNESSSSPVHAHYSAANVSVLPDKNTQVTLSLRRILSELNIEIEDVPEGTTFVATVTDAANGIEPTQKDDEGNFGRPTGGQKNLVTIPQATAVNGVISTNTMRLMPSIRDATNSHLHFTFTLANGTIQEYYAEAPLMKSSGKYTLRMKYPEMKSYMRIDPVKINDWEEGWTVSGEILNPDN